MSVQHTPGPWEWSGGRLLHDVPGSHSETILLVQHETWEPNEANAHLIAAAPELLEALADLFERGEVHVALAGNPTACEQLEAKCRAAIAKARGEGA